MPLEALIKFRAERELEARLARLTRQPEHRGRDFPDLCRLALEDFCTSEEARLRMRKITPAEIEEYRAILMEDRNPTGSPKPADRAVSYKESKPRRPSRN